MPFGPLSENGRFGSLGVDGSTYRRKLLGRPYAAMSVAPAGSPLLPIRTSCWLELDAASSSENGDPAATVNALPSLGVGVCQESVRLGPRACPAPAPTATSSTSTESSPHAAPARRKRLLMVSVCQQNNGPPAERRS